MSRLNKGIKPRGAEVFVAAALGFRNSVRVEHERGAIGDVVGFELHLQVGEEPNRQTAATFQPLRIAGRVEKKWRQMPCSHAVQLARGRIHQDSD